MKDSPRKPLVSEELVSLEDFLKLYNHNLPGSFPKATVTLLQRYKEEHLAFFKHGELWSLDLHRKKIMDWLPYNLKK